MPGASAPILQLLVKLKLHGDGDGGNGLSWLDGVYDDGINTFYLDKAPAWARRWKTLIEESNLQTSARAYEAAIAWAVRQGLRNGSLYSKYGFEYANPASHWDATRYLESPPCRIPDGKGPAQRGASLHRQS